MANFLLPIRTPQNGDDPITHWKRQIGFSEEPVQDTQGYWTIGYGRRLNDTPGGPQPYATISEPIAHDELSYFIEQGGDPNTRITLPDIPSVREIMPTESGGNPGINYRGTQVRFQGEPPLEDIGGTFDYLDEQPPSNPLPGIGADIITDSRRV